MVYGLQQIYRTVTAISYLACDVLIPNEKAVSRPATVTEVYCRFEFVGDSIGRTTRNRYFEAVLARYPSVSSRKQSNRSPILTDESMKANDTPATDRTALSRDVSNGERVFPLAVAERYVACSGSSSGR